MCVPLPAREWVARVAAGVPESIADAMAAAGLPGGPYPATIPVEVAEEYALRDLDSARHREAYVGLLSTVSPELAPRVYAAVFDPETWVPYPDAVPVVEALQERGVRCGVVSNAGFDIRPILAAHGLGSLPVTLSVEVGAIKPSRAIFEAALATLGTRPEETLMVGDHPEADGGAAGLGLSVMILPMSPPGARHGLHRVLEAV